MNFMKKLSLGIGLVFAFLFAHAATPTHAAPFEVNVPDLQSGLEITLEGFLGTVNNHDLDYAVLTTPGMHNLTTQDLKVINPGYDFGFHAAISYIFPDSGNDIRLGYTYLKVDDHESTNASPISFLSPPNNIGGLGEGIFEASAHTEFEYNMVNASRGQHMDVGTRLALRLSEGMRFAEIERHFDRRYMAKDPARRLDENAYSRFEGLGPEFGVEANYHMGGCFGLVGRFYAGLLAGDMRTHTNITVLDENVRKLDIGTRSTVRLIPYVDTKLGVDYSTPFLCGLNVTAELGWQFTHYFNATERMDPTYISESEDNISQNGEVPLAAINRKVSNVSFNGPYLSLHLKI